MKTKAFFFAAVALAFVASASSAPAIEIDNDTGFVCWADEDGCDFGGGGGTTKCDPNDQCCLCKAACTKTNTDNRKTCKDNMDGAALVECNAVSDRKKEECILQCTTDNKCA